MMDNKKKNHTIYRRSSKSTLCWQGENQPHHTSHQHHPHQQSGLMCSSLSLALSLARSHFLHLDHTVLFFFTLTESLKLMDLPTCPSKWIAWHKGGTQTFHSLRGKHEEDWTRLTFFLDWGRETHSGADLAHREAMTFCQLFYSSLHCRPVENCWSGYTCESLLHVSFDLNLLAI